MRSRSAGCARTLTDDKGQPVGDLGNDPLGPDLRGTVDLACNLVDTGGDLTVRRAIVRIRLDREGSASVPMLLSMPTATEK